LAAPRTDSLPAIRPAEITEELNDVWGLVVGYTKQEVRAPLRGLGKFMGWGFAGLTLNALGVLFAVLAILRAFEYESDRFHAYWSFAPFAAAFVLCALVLWLAFRSARKTPWKKEGDAK
jgi:hypothetical protein